MPPQPLRMKLNRSRRVAECGTLARGILARGSRLRSSAKSRWYHRFARAVRRRRKQRSRDGSKVQSVPPARMAAPPPKPRLSTDQRSALVILAASPRGLTKVLMLADGFTRDMLAGLVLAGLATVVTQTVRSGGQTIKVERLRITDAGQAALHQ